jgi:NitT/TauT family transport system substrate-binding protein
MRISKMARHLTTIMLAGLLCAVMGASVAWAKTPVRISLFSWPGYGFWFIIKEKNLAPDLELDIQIIEDPLQSFSMMTAGQLDFMSSTSEFGPIAVEQGMPVRLIALANLSYGTDQIIATSDVNSPADVKGGKVAVMVGGLQQIFVGKWLKDGGVDPKSVEYVNVIMDDAAAAFMGGDVKAGELWEPYASQVLNGLPGSKQMATSRDAEWAKTGLLADAVYGNADFIRNNRDAAVQLMRGLYQAVDFWKQNPAEANKIIADGLKFSVADVENVIGKDGGGLDAGLYPYTFMEAARFCGAAPGNPPFEQRNGEIYAHWRLVNEWWKTFELVKSDIPAIRGVDCSLLRELYETGLGGEPDPTY